MGKLRVLNVVGVWNLIAYKFFDNMKMDKNSVYVHRIGNAMEDKNIGRKFDFLLHSNT